MQRLTVIAALACSVVAVSTAGIAVCAGYEQKTEAGVRIGETVDIDELDIDVLSINGRTYRLD